MEKKTSFELTWLNPEIEGEVCEAGYRCCPAGSLVDDKCWATYRVNC